MEKKKNYGNAFYIFISATLLIGVAICFYIIQNTSKELNSISKELRELKHDSKTLWKKIDFIEKVSRVKALEQSLKDGKAMDVKTIEGYYCNSLGQDITVIQLSQGGLFRKYFFEDSGKIHQGPESAELESGSYFIKGDHIYFDYDFFNVGIIRKQNILEVDERSYLRQFDFQFDVFSNAFCPSEINQFY